jgi:hypothetical protein
MIARIVIAVCASLSISWSCPTAVCVVRSIRQRVMADADNRDRAAILGSNTSPACSTSGRG